MARTKQQQLDDLDALIAAIESSPNQTTSVLGRQFAKHDLPGLYIERKALEVAAARESRGGLQVSRVYPL